MSDCDQVTFTALLRHGLTVTRAPTRTQGSGPAGQQWEVIDLAGELYGTGHSREAAIHAAWQRVSAPHVWRLLAGSEQE